MFNDYIQKNFYRMITKNFSKSLLRGINNSAAPIGD